MNRWERSVEPTIGREWSRNRLDQWKGWRPRIESVREELVGFQANRACASREYLEQLSARGIEAACVGDGSSILTTSLWIRACLRRASRHGVARGKESELGIGQDGFGKGLDRRHE